MRGATRILRAGLAHPVAVVPPAGQQAGLDGSSRSGFLRLEAAGKACSACGADDGAEGKPGLPSQSQKYPAGGKAPQNGWERGGSRPG